MPKLINGFIEEEIEEDLLTKDSDTETAPDAVVSDNENESSNEMEVDKNEVANEEVLKTKKKRKKGIVYVFNIPKHMNVTLIREYLGQYGDIGRVYLQPDKATMGRSKKRKNLARHFTEGWIEFNSKRVAKQLAEKLNNTQIATRKKSKFYDSLWNIKYLPRFKWIHLSERIAYEQAVHKQRLMAEVSQARKERDFFQNNLDKSEKNKKSENKLKKNKDS